MAAMTELVPRLYSLPVKEWLWKNCNNIYIFIWHASYNAKLIIIYTSKYWYLQYINIFQVVGPVDSGIEYCTTGTIQFVLKVSIFANDVLKCGLWMYPLSSCKCICFRESMKWEKIWKRQSDQLVVPSIFNLALFIPTCGVHLHFIFYCLYGFC